MHDDGLGLTELPSGVAGLVSHQVGDLMPEGHHRDRGRPRTRSSMFRPWLNSGSRAGRYPAGSVTRRAVCSQVLTRVLRDLERDVVRMRVLRRVWVSWL
jgi:hypothetical protein